MATCPNCGMLAPHNGPCPRSAQMSPAKNLVLQGRYELIGLLGQGGMGTVYMAKDRRLHDRPCVVKKLRDDFYRAEDKEKAVSFFRREIGVLSKLQHSNIVHILDSIEENDDYYLVMEYVEGRDLHNILHERGEPFEEQQVRDWAIQICDVLEYLHEYDPPVIYRDLKPSNIMLDVKGRIKLVDFGIARPIEEGGEATHVVSAGYSPPEQYWGAADPRSDIYALGTTMYFLLTGKEPVALKPSSARTENPAVSESMEAIVRRATAQDANQRYQSAEEIRQALNERTIKPKSEARSKSPDLLVGAIVMAVAAAGYFAVQFLDKMLDLKGEKSNSSSQAASKVAQEKDKQLNAYRRAFEADAEALTEWSKAAKTKRQERPAKNSRSDMAAQAVSEYQLTDPEGLAPLPQVNQQGDNLFGDN